MTATITGHTWDVLDIQRYKNGRRMGDGDTLRINRATVQTLGNAVYQLIDIDPEHLPCRLAWVNTPETKDPVGWAAARDDLDWWINWHIVEQGHALQVVCFGTAGWDRELVDLRCVADGDSASQWLMTEGNDGAGWPAYTGDAK